MTHIQSFNTALKFGVSLIILICSVLCITSCGKFGASYPDNSIIAPLILFGESFSGDYGVSNPRLEENCLKFDAWPNEHRTAPASPSQVDRLYLSALYGLLYEDASPTEAFVFDRMKKRNTMLLEQYLPYRNKLIDSGSFNDKNTVASFTSIYVKGAPSITADGTLFGQPAGTDLSAWFRFGDLCIIGVIGPEYKMFERADVVDSYQSTEAYFIPNRMMPYTLQISTVGLPEEAAFDRFPVLGGENVIKLTIRIPVLIEDYWDWCKELYSDPGAREKWREGYVTIVYPFECKS